MNLRLFSVFLLTSAMGLNTFALTAPNMSANTLFLYRNSNFHKEDVNVTTPDQEPNGFDLQEAELQFYADVDPYTRLNVLLAVAQSYVTDNTTVSQEWGIEPEEVFAESNALPATTLKIGKFKAFMGKHNTLHSHAYSFIGAPLANTTLLGDEGLNDAGISAAVLLPSSWFSEFTVQYLRGKGENEQFNSPTPGAGVGLIHWKNLVDLSDDLTVELGASYANGQNSFRKITTLSGADLTFKWRPSDGGRYNSLMWATEYLSRTQNKEAVTAEKGTGLASWIQYQFAERWAALVRYDNLEVKDSFDPTNLLNDKTERNSLALVYSPSEFSSYKFEYNQKHGGETNSDNENTEKSVFLQANFTIGAHPSHTY
ncbi:hypothetical protein CIK05_15425 [Bdellovibrio sp. qaytius]|nr:hypothetical protein CIK05_15425 [Bdellovibrio sp. qaytius]